ncbi:unnamed protein product [Auanema sp. JU1783]|nr:unnamed protein product [Auanema sp. JU1783]
MKVFHVINPFPGYSSALSHCYEDDPEKVQPEMDPKPDSGSIKTVSLGSESPNSIRDYHRGSGNLTGGGVQSVYTRNSPSIKKYKSKLDARLGLCIFVCLFIIGSILSIYGVIHKGVHSHLTSYVNRTHQIAKELKNAMDENYAKENLTGMDSNGRKWMTVDELENDAYLLQRTNDTIWTLFMWNIIMCLILSPILVIVHCNWAEGNLVKLIYRVVCLVCLIFCIAQFLYLIHPLLWGAVAFPQMVDRLFLEAYPRDEYQINDIQDTFACEFHPHETLLQFDLQQACIPKLKNSLFPSYTVVLLLFLDVFPFVFAVLTYAWSACIKDSKLMRTARQRVELNNSRRVPFPKSNIYVSPSEKSTKPTTTVEQLPGNLV